MPMLSPPSLTAQRVVRFTPEDDARIERAAARDMRPPAQWIRMKVREALDREDRENA